MTVKIMQDDLMRMEELKFYYIQHGVMPPYSKIAELIGYRSKNSVFEFINRMKLCDRISVTPENRIKPGRMFMSDV